MLLILKIAAANHIEVCHGLKTLVKEIEELESHSNSYYEFWHGEEMIQMDFDFVNLNDVHASNRQINKAIVIDPYTLKGEQK